MNYDDIHLLFTEKLSLFSFNFQKRKQEEKIKCYRSLYFEYKFIKKNYDGIIEETGENRFDGTYSISNNYRRYRVYLRKKRMASLPNWIAILISIITFLFTLPVLLVELLPALEKLGWLL